MTPEVREKVRRLRGKLCSLAEEYKGVCPQVCQTCESPCVHGRELLRILGMGPEESLRIADAFEPVYHSRSRRTQKVLQSMNRRTKG